MNLWIWKSAFWEKSDFFAALQQSNYAVALGIQSAALSVGYKAALWMPEPSQVLPGSQGVAIEFHVNALIKYFW